MLIKGKPFLILLLILLGIGILMWAPWITQTNAQQRAQAAFLSDWQDVADGCGLNCTGCGVTQAQKTWFGVQVEIEYACGLLPEDSPEYHKHSTGFVSFLGTVHGFPRP